MSKKFRNLLLIYSCSAIVVLGITSYVSSVRLNYHRTASQYSAERAFEETVRSVESLSRALEKSAYATDGSMCGRICAEACTAAGAAQSAMATLPFSTQELEQVSGFLGLAGDYAYTLCSEAAEEGFSKKQRETLAELSASASEFAFVLAEMQDNINSEALEIDNGEKRIENISAESDKAQLSDALLEYESGFAGVGELEYSGKYSSVERERALRAPETETRRIAADFAGVEKDELVLEYEYRDSTLRCYSAGDALIYTDAERVRSMSRSRLVSETNISRDEAERLASDFLAERGFENVELASSEDAGALCRLRFIGVSEDVLLPDSEIRLSVALDDGSIYSFDASDYKEYDGSGKWNISYAEAAEKTPEGLKLADIRKVIIENAAGTAMPCYELRCTAEGDRSVNIYLDALSGTQTDIRIL